MKHEHAADIAKVYKPALVIDPLNPAIPECLVVRKDKDGAPFSIHIPSEAEPDADSAGREETRLNDSLDAADKFLNP